MTCSLIEVCIDIFKNIIIIPYMFIKRVYHEKMKLVLYFHFVKVNSSLRHNLQNLCFRNCFAALRVNGHMMIAASESGKG